MTENGKKPKLKKRLSSVNIKSRISSFYQRITPIHKLSKSISTSRIDTLGLDTTPSIERHQSSSIKALNLDDASLKRKKKSRRRDHLHLDVPLRTHDNYEGDLTTRRRRASSPLTGRFTQFNVGSITSLMDLPIKECSQDEEIGEYMMQNSLEDMTSFDKVDYPSKTKDEMVYQHETNNEVRKYHVDDGELEVKGSESRVLVTIENTPIHNLLKQNGHVPNFTGKNVLDREIANTEDIGNNNMEINTQPVCEDHNLDYQLTEASREEENDDKNENAKQTNESLVEKSGSHEKDSVTSELMEPTIDTKENTVLNNSLDHTTYKDDDQSDSNLSSDDNTLQGSSLGANEELIEGLRKQLHEILPPPPYIDTPPPTEESDGSIFNVTNTITPILTPQLTPRSFTPPPPQSDIEQPRYTTILEPAKVAESDIESSCSTMMQEMQGLVRTRSEYSTRSKRNSAEVLLDDTKSLKNQGSKRLTLSSRNSTENLITADIEHYTKDMLRSIISERASCVIRGKNYAEIVARNYCRKTANRIVERVRKRSLEYAQMKILCNCYVLPRTAENACHVTVQCRAHSRFDNFVTQVFQGQDYYLWVALFVSELNQTEVK